ncbi:hypothetical protein N7462_011699 [Penicillium macrosclerotiorum]|uniref:uncharacterized protein n=1 Tax=Penicillium macrosclerotiorum TaxID=303699 RepID=UPI002546935D|nr:uncharacterized protein N7462_011699 [Penicillium macrosclerotiorum]KAJ5662773.1 hypothetical protein N7462_011699 [Penicillium macrosclerotiorum]
MPRVSGASIEISIVPSTGSGLARSRVKGERAPLGSNKSIIFWNSLFISFEFRILSNVAQANDVRSLLRRIQELESSLNQTEPAGGAGSHVLPIHESTRPTTSSEAGNIANDVASADLLANESVLPPFVPVPVRPRDPSPVTHSARLTTSAKQLGPNWFFNGISISSEEGVQWISRRTGQNVTLDDFSIPSRNPLPYSIDQGSLLQRWELPDQSLTRGILNDLLGSSFLQSFPVLDKTLSSNTMEAAYEPLSELQPSPTQVSAQIWVWSFLSIASSIKCSDHISIDAYACSAKAYSLLLSVLEDTSLTTLEAVLMLQLQRIISGHWEGAAFLNSISCRIVCSLKGHLYPASRSFGFQISILNRERKHLRNLFWLCYKADKDISLRTGDNFLLNDAFCDLSLPENHNGYYIYLSKLNQTSDINHDGALDNTSLYIPGDPELSRLKEQVCQKLFSAHAYKDTDNDILLHIRQLDEEIEHWRLCIPPSVRPALFVSQIPSPSRSDESFAHLIQRMYLQLEYHHLMTVIHTTVRRCTTESNDGALDLHGVVHSSFDLSLEASRSTLACLRIVIDNVGQEAYRFITCYASTAVLTLFLDTVIHPLGAEARLGLELLISTANSFREMFDKELTSSEGANIQEISNFMMRLVWLGTSAVMKAEKAKKS